MVGSGSGDPVGGHRVATQRRLQEKSSRCPQDSGDCATTGSGKGLCRWRWLRSGPADGAGLDTLFSFGPDPGSAQLARGIVRRVLEDQPADVRETAALLTSELVTNAVIHTQHPFELNVERFDDRIRVTVADASLEEPVVRDIDPGRERGQGLIIVRALATVWGVGRHPNGKSVWFVLRLAANSGVPQMGGG